jgi:peroxiredoxin
MGMFRGKESLGFGKRSRRDAFGARGSSISHWFVEPGFRNNADHDPYGEIDPKHILKIFLDSLD